MRFVTKKSTRSLLLLLVVQLLLVGTLRGDGRLHLVGYAHLDSQWLWTYETTIERYLKKTLERNFDLFERYPEYQFNFTGAYRYQLMKEYFPELFERLRGYVKVGRWHPAGSLWEENDALVVSPEAMLRQVLYGNRFFEREFSLRSNDVMLPDSFGFPASLPTVLVHAGIKGFSSQKLSWGSARGIPFNLGVWRGPDGSSLFAALSPGPYGGRLRQPPHLNEVFASRLKETASTTGVALDFRYYGIGDKGGAPHEGDVKNLVASLRAPAAPMQVVSGRSGAIFEEMARLDTSALPVTEGEHLLVEHSAGVLTSRPTAKRWNRIGERMALTAEKAALLASWAGGLSYPQKKLERLWQRLLATQMHDILPGTSVPEAYRLSYNDQWIAVRGFESVLESSLGALAAQMDTSVEGTPLLLFNPLALKRTDLVTVRLPRSAVGAGHPSVVTPEGPRVPVQIVAQDERTVEMVFEAELAPLELALVSLQWDETPAGNGTLRIGPDSVESRRLRVTLDQFGDVAQIVDKESGQKLLASPIRYQFLNEFPRRWPAWNMMWRDRRLPPRSMLSSRPRVRVVEEGPVRLSLRVERQAEESSLVQWIRLTASSAVVEIEHEIDWNTKNSSLKMAFPLSVRNRLASYDMGLDVAERPTNHAKQFEVPVHQWMGLSDGARGVAVLNDGAYGADRPNDYTLRQTLLYSPHAPRGEYPYGSRQDFGRHSFRMGVMPHAAGWREGEVRGEADRFNVPIVALLPSGHHSGPLGRRWSFIRSDCLDRAALVVLKRAEADSRLVARFQERTGRGGLACKVAFASELHAVRKIDGQERAVGTLSSSGGELPVTLAPFGLASFSAEIAPFSQRLGSLAQRTLPLPMTHKVFASPTDGMPEILGGQAFPQSEFPAQIEDNGILFQLRSQSRDADAMVAQGQRLPILPGEFSTIHLLLAGKEDGIASLGVGKREIEFPISGWQGRLKGLPIAAFSTHTVVGQRRSPYQFSYLYHVALPLEGASELRFDANPNLLVVAASLSNLAMGRLVSPLYLEGDARALEVWSGR
jgi:alpha-mannosidase